MNVKTFIKKYFWGGRTRELKVELGGAKWEIEKLKKDNKGLAQELLAKKQSLYNWEEFKKTKPDDIRNTLIEIQMGYPEFVDMIKTLIIATRNSMVTKETLKDERRFILLGEKKGYEKILELFEKSRNIDKN